MADPPSRQCITGYVRRFPGWTALCEAFAVALGIDATEVRNLGAGGTPVVFLEAGTQHGDFEIEFSAYVDTSRVTAYRGKAGALAAIGRALREDILYDDGASTNPYRWILLKPDGSRFEVFETAGLATHVLALDPEIPPRLLAPIVDDASAQARDASGIVDERRLPWAQRSDADLEDELARLELDLQRALDGGQDPGADGFARFAEATGELRAELGRRRARERRETR